MERKPTTTAVFVFFSSSITAAALGEYPALVSEQNKQTHTHTLCTCFCVHAKQGEALSWDDRRRVNSRMRHLKRNFTSLQRKEKKTTEEMRKRKSAKPKRWMQRMFGFLLLSTGFSRPRCGVQLQTHRSARYSNPLWHEHTRGYTGANALSRRGLK